MSKPRHAPKTIRPTRADVQTAKRVAPAALRAFKGARGRVRIRVGGKRPIEVELPAAVAHMVGFTIERVQRGEPVQVAPVDEEVSPAAAATMLRVSRPFAQQLMDSGAIPSRLVGRHRRALRADVEAYGDRMRQRRTAALEAAIGESRALGFGYGK